MAILFDKENRVFSLQTTNTTYQMRADEHGVLLHLYYGDRVECNMDYLVVRQPRCFAGVPYELGQDRSYSMDALPREYPTVGTGDFRNSALIVRNADGSECCDLRYVEHHIEKGKYRLEGLPAVYASEQEADTLTILMEDPITKLQVRLLYGVLEKEDIITRSAIITNGGREQIVVEKAASANLDFLTGDYDLISFWGRATMERQFERRTIEHSCQVIDSRRGHSSHQYNPGVILAERNATEDTGSCYGMLFVYSGNFLFEAQKEQFGTIRAMMGLHRDAFHYPLEQGEALIVPETILTYSKHGFAELSHRYHRCIQEHIVRGKYQYEVRPIALNSWEAAYFDFNGETIYQMAEQAAELGIDLVVMDDGWFGNRKDDKRALGDWKVNEEKLGCTLGELIQRINGLGVKFGLWIEPEMVSEDSDLYRAHPDWILKVPSRNPILSRDQLVLDFTRKDVRDCIFEQICTVLDQGNVEYIKWDMNRSLDDIYSSETLQGKVTYSYVLGVYEFAERLRERYPNILIEGCCGGGGRFDAGMLYYTPQIWGSDNTDPIDRIHIQYGTSFFYPISANGSHVTDVPNYLTGRNVDMATRGVVAMAGTFGYELNPAKLCENEKKIVKEQTKTYKMYANLIQTGKYYRLTNPQEDSFAAWQFVSIDQSQVMLNIVKIDQKGHNEFSYIKLKGLVSDVIYEDVATGAKYSGAALMNGGLPMSVWMRVNTSYQVVLSKVDVIY